MLKEGGRVEGLVEVARFQTRLQAELALSALEGSGIEGHIDQPFTSSLHQLLTPAGVRLLVRAADAERARLALRQADED